MNTRTYIELDTNNETGIYFPKIPKEHEQLFRRYIEESRHFQEITQLYQLMQFNLAEIFSHYTFHFNDTVAPVTDKKFNILQINALIGNAVSSAHTLIEAMDIFDRVYISEQQFFKKGYISKTYDEYFSYRFTECIRNYMQHGHIPISFDGEKIFFQISEILDVSHFTINKKLKKQLENIKKELINHGVMETRLGVVPVLYEYFLLMHIIILEFFQFIRPYFIEDFCEVKKVLLANPDYLVDICRKKFVGVYLDEGNMMHGFFLPENEEKDIDDQINNAQLKLEQYRSNNGNLFFLTIHYCLENRIPAICIVRDDDLSQNLEEYCMKRSADIHHLSFDDYYGKMTMYSVYRLYPFIQFKDGLRWNVPYQEVTITDFLRTFPQAKEEGLNVYANNVGGAEELFQTLMQDWSSYLYQAKIFLENIGIDSLADALDWCSRITFVWQGLKWFTKSFSKEKKGKPRIKDLRYYIKQKNEWNIIELANNLHAVPELLETVLQELGYVCKDGVNYHYDEKIAVGLEHERQQYLSKIYDCHGTNVNCSSMNQAIEHLNVNLLYFAILKKEQGKLEEFDLLVQEMLLPLKKFEPFLFWDDLYKCIRISEVLPESFCEEDEENIRTCVEKIDDALSSESTKNSFSNCL